MYGDFLLFVYLLIVGRGGIWDMLVIFSRKVSFNFSLDYIGKKLWFFVVVYFRLLILLSC